MKVLLRNPRREVEVEGPIVADVLLRRLEINPETVLIICNGTLVPRDTRLADTDEVELRPVISGGAA
jgi:sulfur carrier protein